MGRVFLVHYRLTIGPTNLIAAFFSIINIIVVVAESVDVVVSFSCFLTKSYELVVLVVDQTKKKQQRFKVLESHRFR